ncbi:MAG: 16S rRNA (uracil(1498)-N(3))-methyltransferase [Ruminococcus sp.]|nr:16S rRNA (uracil(1498)-N(3))-methyltransferase [Ruminococcus sp.]
MHHFFAEPSQIKGGIVCIEGTDVNHMKNVLRMKAGEKVEVSDGQGTEYLCEVDRYEGEYVFLRIISAGSKEAELPSRIFLFQGLPKGDKMELIIQKAVELGVYQIIPTSTKRAVVKLDAKKAGKKTERWNAIALSAAKQSGRSRVPQVMPVLSFREALEQARELDVVMIPYEQAEGMEMTKKLISAVRPGQDVGIFIGPEGGFEEDEVEKAIQSGAHSITLGKRILRTETAGLAILSILMYHLENS